VDWIEGTIKSKSNEDAFRVLAKIIPSWESLERGGMGYEHSAIFAGGGRLWWSTKRLDMGVHVSFPSKAISALGLDGLELVRRLRESGLFETRVDFALDDTHDNLLDLDTIEQAIESREFVSRFKDVELHKSFLQGGRTYYFGSRKSGGDSLIRIYDKAIETNTVGHWVRVELQLRRERAQAAVTEILAAVDSVCEKICAWLLGYLDFKQASDTDSNKSRWQTATWWTKFLRYVKKARLVTPHIVHTLDDVIRWLEMQVAMSLAVVKISLGEKEIADLISRGLARLKSKHLAMIPPGKLAELGA
jgi:hypothetical protein